jgi:Domain of unknown function (DUF5666)
MNRTRMLTTLLGLGLASTLLHAQPQDRGGGQNFPPGENVVGKVTSTGKDSLVVAPLAGGDTVTVKVSDTTRVTKERQPIKLSDIKKDDLVFVRGQLSGTAMSAAMVGIITPEMAQRIQQGGFGMGRGNGGGRGFGGGAGAGEFNRDDLGKKFIAGEVKAINETKLTIARPDGQTQEIEVDENTSFKRGNESITLPDIKVGDFVRGPGELKNNVFVPKELAVGRPPRMRMGDVGNPSQSNPPGNAAAVASPTPAPPEH